MISLWDTTLKQISCPLSKARQSILIWYVMCSSKAQLQYRFVLLKCFSLGCTTKVVECLGNFTVPCHLKSILLAVIQYQLVQLAPVSNNHIHIPFFWIVKLPQILKIMASKSGKGINMTSVLFELIAIAATACYGFAKGFPFRYIGFVTQQSRWSIMSSFTVKMCSI